MARTGLPVFRKNEILSAKKLNQLVAYIERITIQPPNPGASTGIEMAQDAGGTRLRVVFPATGLLAQAGSGGVSARSGTTPGTGQVTIQSYDPTNNITATTTTVDALNFTTTSIDSGKYCWIAQDENRRWWVIAAEC